MTHTHEQIPTLLTKLIIQSDPANLRENTQTMLEYYKAMDIVDGSTPKPEGEPTDASGTLKQARAEEQAK